MTRSYIQKLIVGGEVSINGIVVTKNAVIYLRDVIQVHFRVSEGKFEAEDLPIEIVYDSPGFAVVNKPAGMNVHPVPGEGGKSGTLVNALLYRFKNLSVIGGEERPGIVHRLDKDTSGLLLIAKDDRMMQVLQKKIEKRTIQKTYLAVVHGIPKNPEGYIESFIGRDPIDRKKMTVHDPINPKIAKTRFRMLESREGRSLLEIDLLTGRTHQIRVHLASIGFPIVGDKTYGLTRMDQSLLEKYGLTRHWLHAYRLDFDIQGKEYHFVGSLPMDLPCMDFDVLLKMR